jgi:chemotaxis response regulator CheB
MIRVDSAARTEEVLRRSSMEAVTRQRILALQDLDAAAFRRNGDRAAHPAIGTGASADGIEAVTEFHFKLNRSTVAPTALHLRDSWRLRMTHNSEFSRKSKTRNGFRRMAARAEQASSERI